MPGFDAGEAYVVREAGCHEGSRVPFDAGEAYVVREAGEGSRVPGFDAGEAYVAEGSRVPGFDAGEAYVAEVEAGCQDLMQGKHM